MSFTCSCIVFRRRCLDADLDATLDAGLDADGEGGGVDCTGVIVLNSFEETLMRPVAESERSELRPGVLAAETRGDFKFRDDSAPVPARFGVWLLRPGVLAAEPGKLFDFTRGDFKFRGDAAPVPSRFLSAA